MADPPPSPLMPNEVPEDTVAPLTYMERSGMTIIADGADEVLKRTRELLRYGATQINLMADPEENIATIMTNGVIYKDARN